MHNLSEVNGQPDAAKPLNTTTLTWAALLGRWIEFARTAVALPDDDTGRCMRASVPDVIMLQAVWFALQHLDDLSSSQRPLGLDLLRTALHRRGKCPGPRCPRGP